MPDLGREDFFFTVTGVHGREEVDHFFTLLKGVETFGQGVEFTNGSLVEFLDPKGEFPDGIEMFPVQFQVNHKQPANGLFA